MHNAAARAPTGQHDPHRPRLHLAAAYQTLSGLGTLGCAHAPAQARARPPAVAVADEHKRDSGRPLGSRLHRARRAARAERTRAAAGYVTKSSTDVCGGREPLRRPRPDGGVGSGHCAGRFSEPRVLRHSSAIGPDAPWVMSSSSPRSADHTSSVAGTAGTAASAAAASAASSTSHVLPSAMAALVDARSRPVHARKK